MVLEVMGSGESCGVVEVVSGMAGWGGSEVAVALVPCVECDGAAEE